MSVSTNNDKNSACIDDLRFKCSFANDCSTKRILQIETNLKVLDDFVYSNANYDEKIKISQMELKDFLANDMDKLYSQLTKNQ